MLMGSLAPALAVLPSERLADPALEARARALSQELRCLVCQNQSIDDSNADLAHDLRVLVRERLPPPARAAPAAPGRPPPPVKPDTYLLWFGPPALLALGGIALALAQRRRRAALASAPAPL